MQGDRATRHKYVVSRASCIDDVGRRANTRRVPRAGAEYVMHLCLVTVGGRLATAAEEATGYSIMCSVTLHYDVVLLLLARLPNNVCRFSSTEKVIHATEYTIQRVIHKSPGTNSYKAVHDDTVFLSGYMCQTRRYITNVLNVQAQQKLRRRVKRVLLLIAHANADD